jgi:ABC-type transport system substrate-binding protein
MTTLAQALYSALYFVDYTNTPQPDLADSYEVSDDNRVWTFHIREDAKFNDGSPVTAEDAYFTFIRALKPMTEQEMLDAGNTVPASHLATQVFNDVVGVQELLRGEIDALPEEAIVVVDPQTIQITLREGRTDFLSRVGYYSASIVKKAQVETSKEGSLWYEKPIGSGPFMIESWVHDQELVLVPNPHYYGTKPTLTRIVMPIVPDPQTRIIMYENDEMDVAKPELTEVAAFRETQNPLAEQMISSPELITAILHLNGIPPLDDEHVRRALELAIDKQLLIQAVMLDAVEVADTFIQKDFPGFDMSAAQLNTFDLEAAKAELAASKYGSDLASMPPLRIFVAGGIASREGIAPGTWQRLAAAIQDMWLNNLGIASEIKAAELESETIDTVTHVNFTRWGAFYPDPIAMVDRWVTDAAGWDTGQASDLRQPIGAPGLTDLQVAARAETDPASRWAILADFETLRAQYVPYIPLYYGRTYVLVKPWVQNLKIGQMWNYPSLNEVTISEKA